MFISYQIDDEIFPPPTVLFLEDYQGKGDFIRFINDAYIESLRVTFNTKDTKGLRCSFNKLFDPLAEYLADLQKAARNGAHEEQFSEE